MSVRSLIVDLAHRTRRILPVLLLLGLCAPLTGCYSRVVGVDGIGTGVREVYEPNLEEDTDQPEGGFKWSKPTTDKTGRSWKAISD